LRRKLASAATSTIASRPKTIGRDADVQDLVREALELSRGEGLVQGDTRAVADGGRESRNGRRAGRRLRESLKQHDDHDDDPRQPCHFESPIWRERSLIRTS
jgi:hypothetical protein